MTLIDLPLSWARATDSAAPIAAGTCGAGFLARTGPSARPAPARTAATSRPRHRRRQQSDIGEGGVATTDAGIVIEHGNAILAKQITQSVCLAGDGEFGNAEEDVGNARLQSRVPERR
jgi:hypothetical protein